MKYGYTKKLEITFKEAIEKVTEALTAEGFGVLTTIDVKATMKKKLDVDYENYTILGACNPQFARKAIEAEKEIGLLLPCNVIVYQDGEKVFVSAVIPSVAMNVVDNRELASIAQHVETKLMRVIDSLES